MFGKTGCSSVLHRFHLHSLSGFFSFYSFGFFVLDFHHGKRKAGLRQAIAMVQAEGAGTRNNARAEFIANVSQRARKDLLPDVIADEEFLLLPHGLEIEEPHAEKIDLWVRVLAPDILYHFGDTRQDDLLGLDPLF